MGYYDDWYEDDDSNYSQIIYDDNPHLIDTVSLLRHYIHCHGVSDKLLKFLCMDIETIEKVYRYCRGGISIKELKKHTEEYIQEGIDKEERIAEAEKKNQELAIQLKFARKEMCGIGTRAVKLLLNKKMKCGDTNAEILRVLLETEDYNIKAKETDYHPEWLYYKKGESIKKCLELYKNLNLSYGVQHSDNYSANAVVFFHLPGTNEQISFHTNFEIEEFEKYPEYKEAWDGLVNSTIPKIEKSVETLYMDEIKKSIEKQMKKKAIN